jgi:hypothetical protein
MFPFAGGILLSKTSEKMLEKIGGVKGWQRQRYIKSLPGKKWTRVHYPGTIPP